MKITKQQKAEVKGIMAEKGIQVFYFPEYDCTVALKRPYPNSDTVQVSIAIKGKDEPKFKKSVGRQIAVLNFEAGIYLPYVLSLFIEQNMKKVAEHLAACFGRIS